MATGRSTLRARPSGTSRRGCHDALWGHRRLLLAVTAALVLYVPQTLRACTEQPLVANIGHALTSNPGTWSTATSRTVSKNQAIYFHALNASNQPLQNTNDIDVVGGQQKTDTAHYDWDYCYNTGDDTHGLTASIAWATPGDRIVRLSVWDTDGAGYTNDADKADSMTAKVTMTVETDSMSGYGLVSMDVFPGRWAGGGYSSVVIDGDHDNACTYHQYLYDFFGTDAELTGYLDSYENQSCDLYLIGIDEWSTSAPMSTYDGYCWDGKYSCVFRGRGAGLDIELHEPACHDGDVGAIDHCTSPNACACKAVTTADTFCASCQQELKGYIASHGP
jgi:hypothetical protein